MRFLPLGLDQKQVLIVNGLTGAPQVRPVLRDGCHMALRSTADGLGRAIFLGVLSMDPLMRPPETSASFVCSSLVHRWSESQQSVSLWHSQK